MFGLHPFAMLISAFDMGSQDVLQVLNRSGRVNVARTPTRLSCCAATMDGQISAPQPFGQTSIGDELVANPMAIGGSELTLRE
jgi:hypothetical protein